MNTLSIHENRGIFSRIRNSPLFFLPLILIAGYALASLTYVYIMQHEGGARTAVAQQAAPLITEQPVTASAEWKPDNPHQAYAAVSLPASRLYLLNSKKTRDYFASSGGDYTLILDQWHYYFQARGIKYSDIQETDLTAGLKSGILILPSAVVLDAAERAAIAAFEKSGGSVLASWATGARNASGAWLGYDFLHDQFDIRVSGEIAAQDKEKFLVVAGETPVTHTLPAGTRIWLGLDKVQERPLRVSGGAHFAGRFMDVVRTPDVADANEAIVFNEAADTSRRVYLGFSESSWRFEQANIYTLLDDLFDWLARRPGAYLANWPYPYRAAQILEMDTEQGYPNALNFAGLLDANGYTGTFYSLTSVAVQFPDIVKQLERKHEIAYHADVHDGFKGQSRELQSKRLDAMREQLTPLVTDPARLRGFRPPYELADQTTESLLFEKNFGHILANSDNTAAMLPYLSPVSPHDFVKGLIVLPRTQRDDMNYNKQALGSAEMARAMNEDFDQAREFGALGVLSVHSQTFAAGSDVNKATAQFLAHIKTSGDMTWVAPGGAIESWWRDRARVKFNLTGDEKNMLLEVTLDAPALHDKSAIVIIHPARKTVLMIKAGKGGVAAPALVPLDEFRTAIVFDALKPGHYSYRLSY